MILLYFNVKCALADRKFIHSLQMDVLGPRKIWPDLVTHQQDAWQQSGKWNISKEDVRSAERDSWLEQWLSATQSTQKSAVNLQKKGRKTPFTQ